MEVIAELSKILGSFRAENLGDDLFSMYTAPAYFPQLLTPFPCLLQGGRGTGKTTVLKSLSFAGQYRLLDEDFDAFNKLDFVGVYYKLETGMVSAFAGGDKDNTYWQHVFSYFINLQLCKLLCQLGCWYEKTSGTDLLFDAHQMKIFCVALGIQEVYTVKQIQHEIDFLIALLESDINYAADDISQKHIPIGSTPRRLVNLFRTTKAFEGKTFYFLLDEYENLQEYQQVSLNTFIKQADKELTFKIGIRELGFRSRHTLNPNEQLVDPADLALIDISNKLTEEDFETFAKSVLQNRFNELRNKGFDIPDNFPTLFEDLSEEEEALKLGGAEIAKEIKEKLTPLLSQEQNIQLDNLGLKDLLLIRFIAKGEKIGEDQTYNAFNDAISDTTGWKTKLNNYNYATLFTLRTKKSGISKYYCGWPTMLALSGRNIRYFLQLVTNSLIEHTKEGKNLTQMISADCQTRVAAEVGRKNLWELEGLSIRGAQLMKVVLGFGELFHRMAIDPEGHAPEVTQFEISKKKPNDENAGIESNEIINSAIMHLALIRSAGTKLSGRGDTRDFDYMLHPVFSAFFVYSHRKKRKITVTPDDVMGMINNTAKTINGLLAKQNRGEQFDDYTQLNLFGTNLS